MSGNHYSITKQVTIAGAIGNFLLTVLKVLFGLLGDSSAVLADGLHSLADLLTDFLVLLTAKIGKQAPDQAHPYGHARVETIGSAVLGIALIVVGIGIGYEAFYHPYFHAQVLPLPYLLAITILSILLNEGLYHYTMWGAKKINSNLLRANAWHKRSDSLSSIIVLVALLGRLFGVHHLDTIAAILVALLIVQMGGKMIWASIRELIDTGLDAATLQQISEQVQSTSGVIAVHQLRSRAAAGLYFVEMHLQVDPYISVSESHFIADSVSRKLLKKFKQLSDVTIHIDIENDEARRALKGSQPSRATLEKHLAKAWADLPPYKELRINYIRDQVAIEILLPLDLLDKEDAATLCSKYQKAVAEIPVQLLFVYQVLGF